MYKYFFEIKNRLILTFIVWFSLTLISYFYKETLLFIIVKPNILMKINLTIENSNIFYFIFTNVTEILATYLQLVIFIVSQVQLIIIIYHLFLFFSPALFYYEYLYLKFIIKTMVLIWFLSALLATYYFIPFTWNFFLSFQNLTISDSLNLHFEAKLNEYLCFYISFFYLYEFYCQFFVFLLVFLNYINVNINSIKKFRKVYYYFFILFSTFISPPDIFSQIFLSIIFIFVFELMLGGILFKTRIKIFNLEVS